MLINGDPSVEDHETEFTGLKKLVPENRKVVAATNGLKLALGNSDANKTAQQCFWRNWMKQWLCAREQIK